MRGGLAMTREDVREKRINDRPCQPDMKYGVWLLSRGYLYLAVIFMLFVLFYLISGSLILATAGSLLTFAVCYLAVFLTGYYLRQDKKGRRQ